MIPGDSSPTPQNLETETADRSRRRAAAWMLGAASGLLAGLMGFPLLRFFLFPLRAEASKGKPRDLAMMAAPEGRLQNVWLRLRQPWSVGGGGGAPASGQVWTDLGPLDRFRGLNAPKSMVIKLETTNGWQTSLSRKLIYITRSARGRLQVLSAVCPHLGCTVDWEPARNDFHCPCHNSVFAPDGNYISGPAPRGMDSLPIRVVQGRLQVRYLYFRNLLAQKVELS